MRHPLDCYVLRGLAGATGIMVLPLPPLLRLVGVVLLVAYLVFWLRRIHETP